MKGVVEFFLKNSNFRGRLKFFFFSPVNICWKCDFVHLFIIEECEKERGKQIKLPDGERTATSLTHSIRPLRCFFFSSVPRCVPLLRVWEITAGERHGEKERERERRNGVGGDSRRVGGWSFGWEWGTTASRSKRETTQRPTSSPASSRDSTREGRETF